MRDRDLLSRPRPTQARETSAARSSSPVDALLSLQQTHGNRAVARSMSTRRVARQVATQPQTGATPPPPTHVSWADQTTAANRPLGTDIDTLEKLSNDELSKKYEEMAIKAAKFADDKHADYERQLEAVEFLAAQRGVKPLAFENNDYGDRAIRRRDVRVVIEAGIRDTGSLKKSIDTMNVTNDIKDDVDFIEREADAWGREFTSQAREIAQKMLAQSISQILDVLVSYGLKSSTAVYGANEIIHGADKDKVVEDIVNAPADSGVWDANDPDPNAPGSARKHRVSLAAYVRNLKRQQEIVHQHWKEANRFVKHSTQLMDHVEDADKPAWEAAMQEVRKSQAHLAEMWAKSERVHPVLAAFRGGKTSLEDVDLGDLDQTAHGSEPQMTEMLKNVLQKLADIGVVQSRLKTGSLNPLSLPPVVAMTKAAMFVPDGSIRAGKVNDLVSAAQDKSITTYIAEGLIALIVIAAVIPSGGSSLGIGISLVGAALSATSAVEDWETYKKQKLLVNTALDRAQALSSEEPSLVPLAIDLISLGFDGAPLVKAFGEGVALRNLIRAGEDVKNSAKVKKLVDELNEIGKAKGDAKLGEKALSDVQAAEKEGAAATKLHPPPGSSFASVEELRQAVRNELRSSTIRLAESNPEWTELWDKVDPVDWVKKFPSDANRLLQARAPEVWKLVRDPQVLEDAMAELWETAARDGISEQEALLRYFGGPEGMPEILDQDPKKFLKAMEADKPMIDKVFTGPGHGSYTHVFQEYAIARKIGRDAAREFRQAITKATGPELFGAEEFRSKVWNAIFDEFQGGYLNCPESLGPILQKNLHLP